MSGQNQMTDKRSLSDIPFLFELASPCLTHHLCNSCTGSSWIILCMGKRSSKPSICILHIRQINIHITIQHPKSLYFFITT